MHLTQRCLAGGFFSRSLDELRRAAWSTYNQEGIFGHKQPWVLLDFRDPSSLKNIKRLCDSDLGGFSTLDLSHAPQSGSSPPHMRFRGRISTELPPNKPEVQRSGYAAWRNQDRRPTLFGTGVWNIDPYEYLGLRVKSDGRRYFVNLQTETIVPTNIHQHRLYARQPGQWETIVIKWDDFVRTNYGQLVEPQSEMMKEKLRSVGIGLTDRVPGPYDLSVSRIWATNDPEGGFSEQDFLEAPPKPGESVKKAEAPADRKVA